MKSNTDPDYQWRPACMVDIGSIARFADTEQRHEEWAYGILIDICHGGHGHYTYTAQYPDGSIEDFLYCQIQYNANDLP